MTIYEENLLQEEIAKLIDKYLDTEVDDLTNIDELIQKEKKEALYQRQKQNNLDAINGGSK